MESPVLGTVVVRALRAALKALRYSTGQDSTEAKALVSLALELYSEKPEEE